ncbi:MAG: hypothetical protein LBH16_11135 [Treponema sp.]|nr:hypothetical protein [Treponema sp.]
MKHWKQRTFSPITLICICAVLSVVVTACNRGEAKPQTQTLSETPAEQTAVTITADSYVFKESYVSNESYAKILNGDLSDFAGTWVNIYDQIRLLKKDGTFEDEQKAVNFKSVNENDELYKKALGGDYYQWSVQLLDSIHLAGFVTLLYPVGVDIYINNEIRQNEIIKSDTTKVRLYIFAHEWYPSEDLVYYKIESSVSDNNETQTEAILEKYKKILLNETGFLDTSDNIITYLHHLNINYKQFAILDMNLYADGIPELVLHNTANGDILVLHYYNGVYNGVVYGKKYSYRAMKNLKIDGFFEWSNSAYNSGLGKLHITGKDQEIIHMAEYGSLMEEIEMYRIQGNPVSKEEFNDYSAFQNAKEDIVFYNLTNENINKLASLSIIPEVPSFPPPIDYFKHINFKPMYKHSDLRLWGWSKNSKVAYTINKSLDPMDGNIFTAVIFNTIDDVVVWQDSLNSNDYKENEYNAAFNNFIKSFMSRAGQNGIEFTLEASPQGQADFKGLPIRHNNQVVNITVETGRKTGDWHEVYGNIGSYKIIAEIATEFPAQRDGRRKTIHEKTLDRPVMDIVTCGYFINPFDNRALIVAGEYERAFEGYDVKYVLIGCHLSAGFR